MDLKKQNDRVCRVAFAAFVGCLAVATAVSGCESTAEEDMDSLGATQTSGAPPTPVDEPCDDEGMSCECEDLGPVGTYVCEDDVLTCDCSECPDLDTQAEFLSCGGDVWGTWRLIETRTGAGRLFIHTVFGSSSECPATFGHTGNRDLAIELREGGEASVAANEHYTETVIVSEACIRSTCENTTYTAVSPFEHTVYGDEVDCKPDDCDTCKCISQVSNDDVASTSWTLDGNHLQIGSGDLLRFPYCAADGQLTLKGVGVVYVFEAVEVTGIPAVCTERIPGECELGVGCELGRCAGTSVDCEGASESSCPTFPGCAWDPSACLGDAPLECDLEDADVVPGCEFEPL